ncbi:MAG TPA: 50S ribosomal protein L9 [Candidatus Sulfomarinibacteraceae bacterium]|nr:50S ribosomal protein L9 [Candidatus Sulfomarinibacteraceae bacterium]
MKVLLKEDVDNLGYAGEVHDVADGYGRNYLLPRGLAVLATPGVLKQASAWRAQAEARRAEQRALHEELTDKINETHLVFRAKAGETGRLYGSVTMMDVAERLNEELGTEIDRRKFDSDSLRELGEHRVTIHLDRDFHPQLLIYIHPEGAETEEADEEAQTSETEEAVEAQAEVEEVAEEEAVTAEADVEPSSEGEEVLEDAA